MPRGRRKNPCSVNEGEREEGDDRRESVEENDELKINGSGESSALTDGNIGRVTRSSSKSNDRSPAKKLRLQLLRKVVPEDPRQKERDEDPTKTIDSKYFESKEKVSASQKVISNRKRGRVSNTTNVNTTTDDELLPRRTKNENKKRKGKQLQSDVLSKKGENEAESDFECSQKPEKRSRCRRKLPCKAQSDEKKACKKSAKPRKKSAVSKGNEEEKVEDKDENLTSEENNRNDFDSDSESEWEEVEELPQMETQDSWQQSQIPDKPVQITLSASDLMTKRKKGKVDIKDIFRRQLNRFRTEAQENAHKVHLLCLLSHGHFTNVVCCSVLLKSVGLSLVPLHFLDHRIENWTLSILKEFSKWFKSAVSIRSNETEDTVVGVSEPLLDRLLTRFSQQSAETEQEFLLMFVVCCRSVGLLARLIFSLHPITFKPSDLKKNKPVKSASALTVKKTEEKDNSEGGGRPKNPAKAARCGSKRSSLGSVSDKKSSGTTIGAHSKEADRHESKTEGSNPLASYSWSRKTDKTKNQQLRRQSSKINYNEEENESLDESKDTEWKNDDVELSDSDSDADNRRKSKKKKKNSSDEDFEESAVEFRLPNKKSSKRRNSSVQPLKRKSSSIQISDEDKFLIVSKSSGGDWWIEVYLEEERNWICVNGRDLTLNCPKLPETQTTLPLSYILAYDNVGNVKDVTAKFSSNWLSTKNKVRLDDDWWKRVLQPFQNDLSEKNAKEDADIHERLLKKPLPTNVSDFKNHPLYALKRHLLKYEAIYPESAPVLGQIRGESVYPRESVHCLHAKEKWLLEGRLVRIDEEPYKIVKARPKWNKPKEFNDRLKLPLFGFWQTERYIPKPAFDGKVPKNDYGNVEVFKPWMVPGGTVYLSETMTGLGRVAKKLEIDVAPAMVGWDFHSGFNVPVLQGWIVCEEHRDVLVAAWEEEQAIQQQKEADKRLQKVLNNWKLLTKGLLIREKLKRRFQLEEPPEITSKQETNDGEVDEEIPLPSISMSWPENRKKEFDDDRIIDSKNLFPFEKEYLSSSHNLEQNK